MTKTEQLKTELIRAGYQRMNSNLTQFSLYYQTEQDQVRGILLVLMDEAPGLTAEQLEHIHSQVYQTMLRLGSRPVLLTLAAGRQIAGRRAVLSGLPACWLWDTESGRLIIYEHQPVSFFGLEKLLERMEEPRTGAYEYAGGADPGIHRERRRPKERWRGIGDTWHNFLHRSGRKRAVVNMSIIVINVVVFCVLELFGSTEDAEYMALHGAAYTPWIYQYQEYYRLFTCMFMHFGISHLMNNMVVLFLLGDNVERAVGRWKYLVIYLMSGMAGSILSYAHAILTGDYAVSAGASGAIFGVIGALFYIVAVNKGRLEDMTTRKLGLLIVISLYHGFTGSGVDNYAHIGGLAAGALLAAVLYRKEENHRENA